jgi:hypothetical protein
MEPIILYYRDSVECVRYLLNNPLFANCMNFVPVKHYTSNGKRVVKEAVSAQQAWQTQVCFSFPARVILKHTPLAGVSSPGSYEGRSYSCIGRYSTYFRYW